MIACQRMWYLDGQPYRVFDTEHPEWTMAYVDTYEEYKEIVDECRKSEVKRERL